MALNPITYSALLTKIASRLNRDDLDAAIREIAAERISYYGDAVFYNCQIYDRGRNTVAGQKFYDLPAAWEQVNSVRVLQGTSTTGIWLTLLKRDYEFINNLDAIEPGIQSVPRYWCLFTNPFGGNRAIRMFPTPGTTYVIEYTMDQMPGVPQDNAVNWWCDDGQNLILYATCAEMTRVHLHDPIRKQEYAEAETRERMSLESKSVRARGGIQIRSYFP